MTIEIANRLVQLRKKSGLSQEELADKLGISRQAVSKWERAEACPDTDNLIVLAKLYGVSLDSLLACEEEEEMPKEEKQEETVDAEERKMDSKPMEEEVETVEGEVVDPVPDAYDDDDDDGERVGKKSLIAIIFSSILFPLTVLAYILMGFFWKTADGGNIGWAAGWVIFLLMVFVSSIFHAVRSRRATRLAIPVLVVAVYCGTCIIAGFYGVFLWHPLWVLFLVIPFYYGIVGPIEAALKERSRK